MEYSMMVFFSLFIVAILYVRAVVDKNVTKLKKMVVIITFSLEIILMLSEAFGNLIGIGIIHTDRWVNITLQVIYFISLAVLSYSSFLLCCLVDNSRIYRYKRYRYVMAIPALILIIFALITPFTGSLFVIDDENRYVRGNLNFLQIIFTGLYLLIGFGVSIYKLIDKKYFTNRGAYISIMFFTLIPILGTITQFVLANHGYDYPYVIASISVASVILYLRIMQGQVQTDFLTDLYNKNKLFTYLHSKMKSDEGNLYLILLDINRFKKINDTYGHVEGDEAIKLFGGCIKDFCREKAFFGARYGGDEFIIVANSKTEKIDEIVNDLKKSITTLNENDNKEYNIEAAIGYAKYCEDIKTIPDFISIADKMMYANKKQTENYLIN